MKIIYNCGCMENITIHKDGLERVQVNYSCHRCAIQASIRWNKPSFRMIYFERDIRYLEVNND